MDDDRKVNCVCGWEGTMKQTKKDHGFDLCPECGASLSHR